MTTTDPRARLGELTDHLTGMADSLDDHVTHEDVHRLLLEARQLSLRRDDALTAVLDALDKLEKNNIQNSLALGEIDPGTTAYSEGHLVGFHKGRIEAAERIREAITDTLALDKA